MITSISDTLSIEKKDQIAGKPNIKNSERVELNKEAAKHEDLSTDQPMDQPDKVKSALRPFLKGGDVEIIAEYTSPFNTYSMLNVKLLFAFSLLYLAYLLSAIRYDMKAFKFSYLLPSMATIYLGIGHQRTVAFPFLVALPLITPHLKAIYNSILEKKNDIKSPSFQSIPWIGAIAYLCTVSYFYAPINAYPLDFIGLSSISIEIRKIVQYHPLFLLIPVYLLLISYWLWIYIRKEKSIPNFSSIAIVSFLPGISILILYAFKPVNFFEKAIGFLLVYAIIPCFLYGIRQLSLENQNRYFFRYNSFIFWGLPLLLLIQFGFSTHATYKKTNNLVITGLSDRQPGLGRNNYLDDTMPEYIYNQYKHEDMFNSYNIGSYLLWKWYPEKKFLLIRDQSTIQMNFTWIT